ncbi:MAG: AAA family ATPase, partial [Deltaproteobacteria bacterium]|nr:AAA family ATPase [Deltaproteobacteria bacterium]MDR2141610.1 AAA family ATPase [Deltaproteobacteria bacterium]
MTLKKFSLADQTFADIIDKNYFYVDKTRYIYELWNSEEN